MGLGRWVSLGYLHPEPPIPVSFSLPPSLSLSTSREGHPHRQFHLSLLTHEHFVRKIPKFSLYPNTATMSHAVFHTAQIMPMNSHVSANTLSPKPSLPLLPKLLSLHHLLRRRILAVRASSSAAEVESDSASLLERCFAAPAATGTSNSSSPSSSSSPLGPVMKGQYGSLGAVTLEKSKLDMTQKQTTSSPEVSALSLYVVQRKLGLS